MAEDTLQMTSHRTTAFDPEVYIETIYGETSENGKFVKFMLDALHHIYSKGEVTGKRLLDIGTGPVVHHVFPALGKFNDIALSDVSSENLEVLRKWKTGEIRHQESVFKYLLDLQGSKENWLSANKRLSEKVSAIVYCDLNQESLLLDGELKGVKFDTISLCLCQNAATTQPEEYKQNIVHYSNLLKQGGHLIVIDTLEEHFYTIGRHRFQVMYAKKDMIQDLYKSCGFDILHWTEQFHLSSNDEQGEPDGNGVYAMLAKKLK